MRQRKPISELLNKGIEWRFWRSLQYLFSRVEMGAWVHAHEKEKIN